MLKKSWAPIGIFDSGYGGLTVFQDIKKLLPEYDYIYLGDNAHAPYGSRSFQTVYEYTLKNIRWLFENNCPLIILACNTASAKALRTIQQNDLEKIGLDKRVLGVIRPTAEIVGNFSKSHKIGVLGTLGTVNSGSYPIEIHKFFPTTTVYQQACPEWVSLIESGNYLAPEADAIIEKHTSALMAQDSEIDTILLGCTHYPLLQEKIKKHLPKQVTLLAQGTIVANSLEDYLQRNTTLKSKISTGGQNQFFTSGSIVEFNKHASVFFGNSVTAKHIAI